MRTKIYSLVMFDRNRRNWKEGIWGQRVNTCCIQAVLVFFDSYCEGVAAEQLLGVAKERNSCGHEQSLSDEEGQIGRNGVGWGRGAEATCPYYSQRCLISRNRDCTQDVFLWRGNEEAGYLILICILASFSSTRCACDFFSFEWYSPSVSG